MDRAMVRAMVLVRVMGLVLATVWDQAMVLVQVKVLALVME